jgi:hypothetical protein
LEKIHRRRDGYWTYYHLAHTQERDSLLANIVSLVKENKPPVKPKQTRRGRKSVHSWEKLVCICIIMVVMGYSFRDMQNNVPSLNLPWNEPYPDHSTIHKAFQKIDEDYLDLILEKTAYLCIKETSWKKGVLGADSSGVETDRYETVMRPNKKKGCFEEVRRRIFLKYHVVAILDYLVILRAKITSERQNDSPVLRSLLQKFRKMKGSVFNADKGYDAEANFKRISKAPDDSKHKADQPSGRSEGCRAQAALLQNKSSKDLRRRNLSLQGDDRSDLWSRRVRRTQSENEI